MVAWLKKCITAPGAFLNSSGSYIGGKHQILLSRTIGQKLLSPNGITFAVSVKCLLNLISKAMHLLLNEQLSFLSVLVVFFVKFIISFFLALF